MNYYFKNIMLASSCLVTSLSVSYPGFSMDPPTEEIRIIPQKMQNTMPVKQTEKNQAEENSFFTITDFGNRKFDYPAWVAAIEQAEDNQKKESLFQILEKAVSEDEVEDKEKGPIQFSIQPTPRLDKVNQKRTPRILRKDISRKDEESILMFHLEELKNQQKKDEEEAFNQLYLFSIKRCFGLDKVNQDRARKILKKGLLHEHGWVVPIYTEKLSKVQAEAKKLIHMRRNGKELENLTPLQEEALCLLREIVNTPLPDSELVKKSSLYLDMLYPFDGSAWIESYVHKQRTETLDQLLHRLKGYGYYKHFRQMYQLACNIEGQLQQPQPKKPLPGYADIVKRKLDFLKEGEALGDPIALHDLWQCYKSNGQYEESKKTLFRLAQERQMAAALFNIGNEYTDGDMLEKNPQKSFEWYAKAAEKGMGRAIVDLIIRFWLTNGDQQDFAKAFKWLKKLEPAARKITMNPVENQKNTALATVLCQLGRCYHYGYGVEKDAQKAFELYNEAAQLDDENASICLAMAYQYGNGIEKNLEKAITCWENAKKRSPEELVSMGQCYEDRGREIQQKGPSKKANKHFKKAYACYRQAAEQGDGHAMYRMATHHYQGLACAKDLIFTRKYLKDAINAKYMEAKYALGSTYLFSQPKDLKLAEKWLREAAEANNLSAMINLGLLYDMEQNKHREGFSLYKQAAELGSEVAQYNCGILLLSNLISETDDDENRALAYLHQAAEKDHPPSMSYLGTYYLERSETTSEQGRKNLESACFWLEKAAALGDFNAKTLLKEAESKIGNESDNSILSPDFERCLKNIENIEKGIIENKQELEFEDKRITSLFKELREEKAEIESSDSDNELLEPLEENVEEDKHSQLSDIEPEESFETWKQFTPPKNEALFKNPKWLREKLREASLALKKKQEESQIAQTIQLSSISAQIINMLKSKHKRENITYAALHKLFSDPYFKAKGHVELYSTKSGLAISAKSFEKMEARSVQEKVQEDVMTTGTHHNHNKTYKGYNPEFLKNVVKILEMFDV